MIYYFKVKEKVETKKEQETPLRGRPCSLYVGLYRRKVRSVNDLQVTERTLAEIL